MYSHLLTSIKVVFQNSYRIHYLFIYLFLAVLCLFVARTFSSWGELRLPSSCDAQVAHCSGLFCYRTWALGCAGFSSCSMWAQELQSWALEHRPKSHGTKTLLLCGMRGLPGSEFEPVSPALVGGFIISESPRKLPWNTLLNHTHLFTFPSLLLI